LHRRGRIGGFLGGCAAEGKIGGLDAGGLGSG
jgi:hypothetical protein